MKLTDRQHDDPRNLACEDALFRAIKRAAQKSISCPSNAELANIAGLTQDQTKRALRRLVQKGRVTRELKGSGDSVRRLVVHPEGDATGWTKYGSRQDRNRPRVAGGRKRPCMSCGKIFTSAGNHNRLCNRCRSKSDDPLDPYSAPGMRSADLAGTI